MTVRTQRRRSSVLLLAGSLALVGCRDDRPSGPQPGTDSSAGQHARPTDRTTLHGQGDDALSEAELGRLLVNLASCELGQRGLALECEAFRRYQRARRRATGDLTSLSTRVALKHLTHRSAAVRFIAAGLVGAPPGASGTVQQAALQAIPDEKSPLVLARLIAAVAPAAKDDPKIAQLVLQLADHPEEAVRQETVVWLGSDAFAQVQGALDKVIEKIENDPAPKVRQAACRNAGKSGDERLIPIYRRLTRRPRKAPGLYAACMQGLMALWNPLLAREAPPSARAFALTLSRMNEKPRSRARPPWQIMRDFGRVPPGKPRWYRTSEQAMRRLLLEVALDDQARWLARTGAVWSLGKLGATDELQRIGKALATKTDFDSRVVARAVHQARSR
jgi:hypothetical protein